MDQSDLVRNLQAFLNHVEDMVYFQSLDGPILP